MLRHRRRQNKEKKLGSPSGRRKKVGSWVTKGGERETCMHWRNVLKEDVRATRNKNRTREFCTIREERKEGEKRCVHKSDKRKECRISRQSHPYKEIKKK